MKVFLSWSGAKTKSHAVARALDEWLPTVLNAVEPWVSSRGLVAGLQWNQQLDKELDDTNFGIIVVTPWNQHSQWLNFEAGALSKRVGGLESRVAPLLIDFPNVAKLTGPLSGYQVVLPTRDGIHALVVSLNQALGEEARKFEALEKAFEVCWPALESTLEQINKDLPSEEDPSTAPSPQPTAADDTDMLSEILNAVRGLARSDARLTNELRKSASSKRDVTSAPEVRRGSIEKRGSVQQRRILLDLIKMGHPVVGVSGGDHGNYTIRTEHELQNDQEVEIANALDWDRYDIRSLHFRSDALEEEAAG